MKKMWPVFIVFCITLVSMWAVSTAAIAMDQCDVVGNSYTITIDGNDWTLSNFDESLPMFSPAPKCAGTVTLLGPTGQYSVLDWCVCFGELKISGLHALLSEDGLMIYLLPSGLHTLRVGDTVYMTEQEIPQLLFK